MLNTVTLRGCIVPWAILGTIALANSTFAADQAVDSVGVESVRIDIKPDDLIVVPVQVFDKTLRFVVDTGCGICLVDSSFEGRLGEPIGKIRGRTSTSAEMMSLYKPPVFEIGGKSSGFQCQVNRVCILDFSELNSISGESLSGIVGIEALRLKTLRLNYDKGFAEILDHTAVPESHVEKIRFNKWGIPTLLLSVSGSYTSSFVVDTGANGPSIKIEKDVFIQLERKNHIILAGEEDITEINGTSSRRTGIVDTVQIGPHRFHNMSVSESVSNSISLRFLSRFNVDFDFPERRAHFLPSRLINRLDGSYEPGFTVRLENQALVAIRGSDSERDPAVKKGDKILKVNGIAATELGFKGVEKIVSAPGTEIEIVVERSGAPITLKFKLSDGPKTFPNLKTYEFIDDAVDFVK